MIGSHVPKLYSVAFKQKMVARLIGKHPTSACQLSKESGVSQDALSRWRREASSLPMMAPKKLKRRTWPLNQKIEILAAVGKLEGQELLAYLQREGVTPAEIERWRRALDEDGASSVIVTKQVKQLERELARKDKALAEAAALLILKKKLEDYYSADEDESTDEESEK